MPVVTITDRSSKGRVRCSFQMDGDILTAMDNLLHGLEELDWVCCPDCDVWLPDTDADREGRCSLCAAR